MPNMSGSAKNRKQLNKLFNLNYDNNNNKNSNMNSVSNSVNFKSNDMNNKNKYDLNGLNTNRTHSPDHTESGVFSLMSDTGLVNYHKHQLCVLNYLFIYYN